MPSLSPLKTALFGPLLAAVMISNSLLARQQLPGPLAADRALSEESGRSSLAVALGARLDSQAVLLWPGAPVIQGAEAVRRFLAAQPILDSVRVVWQPLAFRVAADSTLGFTWGFAVSSSRAGEASPAFGRYIAAWRADAGRWVVAAAMISLTNPDQALVPGGMPAQLPALARETNPFVAADLDFARLAADSGAQVAFERWAASDAMVFGPAGVPVRGPSAIGRLVSSPASWVWRPVASGASRDGESGWTVGESEITPRGMSTNRGKYLTLWIRTTEPHVRYLTDGGNSRP